MAWEAKIRIIHCDRGGCVSGTRWAGGANPRFADDCRVIAELASPPPLTSLTKPALFLDFDGTLVEIADTPEGISVPGKLLGALSALSDRAGGRLALVSGRSVGDLEGHLGAIPFAVAGSHGGEVRRAGTPATAIEPLPPTLVSAAERFVADTAGVRLERKPLGLAVHYRQVPERESDVLAFAQEAAGRHEVRIKRGKMVAELITHAANKGTAIAALMQDAPFAGSLPVFLGDDVTDEDGFAQAAQAGGFGILVGEPRETAARYRLDSPRAVHDWLGL